MTSSSPTGGLVVDVPVVEGVVVVLATVVVEGLDATDLEVVVVDSGKLAVPWTAQPPRRTTAAISARFIQPHSRESRKLRIEVCRNHYRGLALPYPPLRHPRTRLEVT
jgi:hypothetical protein